MKTLVGFLHVGLLVFWLGSPGAAGNSVPIEKPGLCPVAPYFCPLHERYCHEDSDCPGEKKCCLWCGMVCKTPKKVKPGVCPVDDLIVCLKPRPRHLCKNDFDCPGYQKCCFNKCGKSCEDP